MLVWVFLWPWFTYQVPEAFYPDAPEVFSLVPFVAAFVRIVAIVATMNEEWRWVRKS